MHTLLLGMTLIAHGYYMGDMLAKNIRSLAQHKSRIGQRGNFLGFSLCLLQAFFILAWNLESQITHLLPGHMVFF